MKFTDLFEKFLIKMLAPAVVVKRGFGISQEEIKYWAGMFACWVFKDEPIDKDGYYKAIYINNKRLKPWHIIPRNALIEIRLKPQKSVVKFLGGIVSTAVKGLKKAVGIIAGLTGLSLLVNLFTKKKNKGISDGVDRPTYQSTEHPDLTGSKNELAEGVIPVAFGRVLQTFNYNQFCYPLIRSGYSGNRYRVFSTPGYLNARYEDFRLGDVPLSSYRTTSYSLQQANGQSGFIGWDNATTESFNRELSFDQTQAVFQSAIVYHNVFISNPTYQISFEWEFTLTGVTEARYWTNKVFDITVVGVMSDGTEAQETRQVTMTHDNLRVTPTGITAVVDMSYWSAYSFAEYRYTIMEPNGATRGNQQEANLLIELTSEKITIGDTTSTIATNQGVNSYNGDRNELISQSLHDTKFCDIHFSFPQGLYTTNEKTGARVRVTISAEVKIRKVGDKDWGSVTSDYIKQIYTRDVNGVIQPLSSRITRSGDVFTFRTPEDINNADGKFYEGVGFEFVTPDQYQIKVMPIMFTKDSYWVGTIYLSEVVWRLDPSIPVLDNSILPHVSQIACTFNATTQLDGEVDQLCAINRPYILNIETMELEQSRNPVDIMYYLLTDTHSNPDPMSPEQIDMPSFLKARKWCQEHNCLCDGIIPSETKYSTVLDEIANNNQLYFIPNKWGRAVIKVDTNEDDRPIKSLFNADNSWDLTIVRKRGKLNRALALRYTYIDEETWSQQEITGYWYNNQCNWEPEPGKDDTYYQPEVRELNYIKNADNVKRRIAYELEISNVKNVTASFKIAREVLDLDVLDRVLVADYTRISDGVSGTIINTIVENGMVTGFRTSLPFVVTQNMTITVRSVDLTGQGVNVNTYSLKPSSFQSATIFLEQPIPVAECNIRGVGIYQVDGRDFYYTGDLYMAGTAEILDMVVSDIDEISGEDFTSAITCRLY